MDYFNGYKLEYIENGYTLILYLNPNTTEFAQELDNIERGRTENLYEAARKFADDNFKDIKINTVKIVLGSVLVGAMVLGTAPTPTAAANEIQAAEQIPSVYTDYVYHTVASGDTLWAISRKYGTTIDSIVMLNGLKSTIIYPGQRLKIKEQKIPGIMYSVTAGDTLWKISRDNNTTIAAITAANGLTSDVIMIGQKLFIPISQTENTQQNPVYNWPDVTYIVQPGDTAVSIARKFNTSADDILRYNYMMPDEWFDAGDKIAISGYAPRTYTVKPGESPVPARVGKPVNWVTEAQYVVKRGDILTVVDVDTGRQFKIKMLGGYNHADVETVTKADTDTMKTLFGTWQWAPRAVVIYKDGMNMAASLSGMPHSIDTIDNNGVTGHFDLYFLNSLPHAETASQTYVEQHRKMAAKAAGQYK